MSTMKRSKVDIVNDKSTDASGEIFDLIHTIMHLFRSQQYRGLRGGKHEMTHMEGKLLGFFTRHPGATLSDLVAHSGRDKGQLARLVKSLKAGGLLNVQQNKKEDRRSVGLEATRSGHSVNETLHRQSTRLVKVAVHGLKGVERRQLLALLQRVRTNLENISESDR
jgi:DNA-binding MarR family transcriptional regulator